MRPKSLEFRSSFFDPLAMNKFSLISKYILVFLLLPTLTKAADTGDTEKSDAPAATQEEGSAKNSQTDSTDNDDARSGIENFYIITPESQIKLLHQTMEFKVLDNDSIQVGNLILSAKNMRVYKKDPDAIIFEAPQQFLVGGTLILKDPHGKAIWSQTIVDPSEIVKGEETHSKETNAHLKSGLFYLQNSAEIEAQLAKNSFFTFCLFSETKTNRVQVCTPNYSLKQTNDSWEPVMINSERKEHTLFVNGSEVGENGVIQFDQNIKTASLTALLISGLSVELRSDFIPLQLMDATFNQANSTVNFKAREKTPGNKKSFPWEANVATSDSTLFVEAYGQVPLRQYLSINSQLIPTKAERPTLMTNNTKTYSSSMSVKFKGAEGLSFNTRTDGDAVDANGTDYEWTLNNLAIGYNKAHLLEIGINKKKLLGSYEVERAEGWDLGFALGGGNVSSLIKSGTVSRNNTDSSFRGDLYFQKYYDGLFGMTGPANLLRWGIAMSVGGQSFSSSKINVSNSELNLIYRLTSGFYYLQPSSSLQISYRNNSSSTTTTKTDLQWVGFKLSHDGPAIVPSKLLGSFHIAQLGLYPVCLSENCKGSSLINASWQSRYDLSKKSYWSWKALYESWQSKSSTITTTTSTVEIQGGMGFRF